MRALQVHLVFVLSLPVKVRLGRLSSLPDLAVLAMISP